MKKKASYFLIWFISYFVIYGIIVFIGAVRSSSGIEGLKNISTSNSPYFIQSISVCFVIYFAISLLIGVLIWLYYYMKKK